MPYMDQYVSTVVIALITGIFSIVTLIIQKKQDKVINKIDEQTSFIEKEKALKQKLLKKQEEKETLLQRINILILDTNMEILANTETADNTNVLENMQAEAEDLKGEFKAINRELESLDKEYNMLLELSTVFKKDMEAKTEKN